MTHADIAVGKFKEGYNCAQSVLYSYAEKVNISKDMSLRIANGFGGGMGRKQEVCGAISGAIMVLGLIYGRGENEGKEKQETTYSKVRELIDAFVREYGTINCKQLLSGCVLLTDEGQKQFKERALIEKCHEYVRQVTAIIDVLI
jgi:C_GCAxxG_C_C family probable redox protein